MRIFKVYTKVKNSITKIKTICVGHAVRPLCKWELLQGEDQAKEEKTRSWIRDVQDCWPTHIHIGLASARWIARTEHNGVSSQHKR